MQWEAHNLFEPQPAKYRNTSACFLRSICYDWSDLYASRILDSIAGVMGPSSKLLFANAVLPPAEVQLLCSFHLSMLCQLNAQEGAVEDWGQQLRMANQRLEIVDVKPLGR